ncbi:hypothetical protein MMC09_003223 [Bachmanniomyces sp. S44760]|nr:hypothetical protein [Bachmanniomyces sp. S44760]
MVPSPLLSFLDTNFDNSIDRKDGDDRGKDGSRVFAAKSEAMRRILGLDQVRSLSIIGRPRNLSGLGAVFNRSQDQVLPGLGNWDNSCYQNSMIQGLASLPSFSAFLNVILLGQAPEKATTSHALIGIIKKLNMLSSPGQRFWTPAELKSMSSWQQQDAQEYYSKLLDELEKEVSRSIQDHPRNKGLLEMKEIGIIPEDESAADVGEVTIASSDTQSDSKTRDAAADIQDEPVLRNLKNPLEGLLAQRVGCLQCGYVEGLSLIPFNCLTVPLGSQWKYDIATCLNEYTSLESINGVECVKCSLLWQKEQIERLLATSSDRTRDTETPKPQLSDTLSSLAYERLRLVQEAIDEGDYSDGVLKKCQIPTKARVSSTKSRQAVVARAPESLAIHVNRSVFNETTGAQSKNYADVSFPRELDLDPWCLGNTFAPENTVESIEAWTADPSHSMLSVRSIPRGSCDLSRNAYVLRAVVTHYGRHENGHYICYRRTPDSANDSKNEKTEVWWRLSDDDVSEVSEDNVLAQGGVFMLFYEKIASNSKLEVRSQSPISRIAATQVQERTQDVTSRFEISSETVPMEEDEIREFAKVANVVEQNSESPTITPSIPTSITEKAHKFASVEETKETSQTSAVCAENTDAGPGTIATPESHFLQGPLKEKENLQVNVPMRTAGPSYNGRGKKHNRPERSLSSVTSLVKAV